MTSTRNPWSALVLALFVALSPAYAASAPAPAQQPRKTPAPAPSAADPLAPLLSQAQNALDRNDYATAIPLLQKILADRPADALLHFELGYAYSALQRFDEAVPEYRRAAELKPDLAPAHLDLGLALMKSDPAAALESFRRAEQLLPSEARPHVLAAEALERSGKLSGAIDEYTAAVSLAPREEPIRFALARAFFATARMPEAESQFREAIALKPDAAPPMLGLAETLSAEKKTVESVDAFASYLTLTPGDGKARFERAVALNDLNRFDEALAELGRLDAGTRDAENTWPRSLKLRGSIYMRKQKWTEAGAVLEKAVIASPDDAEVHAWLGHTRMETHDYPGAVTELQRALTLNPVPTGPLRDLVGVYYLSGQYVETLNALDLLSKKETPTALDWFFRAICCDKLGRKPEAAAAYQQFLDLDRGQRADQDWQAQQRLKLLLRELKRK